MLNAYTDGACSQNGTWDGGWGVVIVSDTGEIAHTISGGEKNTTNNRMELIGFLNALQYAAKNNSSIRIHTDSAYICNAFNQNWVANWQRNGWKNSKKQPVKNQDLWVEILKLKSFLFEVVKVKGHANNEYNNLADKLAVGGRSQV